MNSKRKGYDYDIKGPSYKVQGSINSNYDVIKVFWGIFSHSGHVTVYTIDYPNTKSMDVQSGKIKSGSSFSGLPVGDYTLYVAAMDASENVVEWSTEFTVRN